MAGLTVMQKKPLVRFVREPRCFLEYTSLVLSIFLWASTANAISTEIDVEGMVADFWQAVESAMR
jgi:hypothetical protein